MVHSGSVHRVTIQYVHICNGDCGIPMDLVMRGACQTLHLNKCYIPRLQDNNEYIVFLTIAYKLQQPPHQQQLQISHNLNRWTTNITAYEWRIAARPMMGNDSIGLGESQ